MLERFTSDLWVQGAFAFTGTWGTRRDSTGTLNAGNALKVWSLLASGEPFLADSLILDGVGTVSDVEVSASGTRVLLTTERGSAAGFFIYALDGAGHPTPVTSALESDRAAHRHVRHDRGKGLRVRGEESRGTRR